MSPAREPVDALNSVAFAPSTGRLALAAPDFGLVACVARSPQPDRLPVHSQILRVQDLS